MAETLSAVALVTASAKGNSLVFWWPPSPVLSPRFSRARPPNLAWPSFLDNPWRASHPNSTRDITQSSGDPYDASEYHWSRPLDERHKSFSDGELHPRPTSSKGSPSRAHSFSARHSVLEEYDRLLGYSSEYLANLLCPHPPMCHQKFELLVDDVVFLGHPVCADADGIWGFKTEKNSSGSRGRDARESHSPRQHPVTTSTSSEKILRGEKSCNSTWLQTFHLVLIFDLPEPSSSASGNVLRYFDVIYEQIIFVVTAVLFQEQVQSNFVERECDILGTLKESCRSKEEPFSTYAIRAIEQSSVAPAMKALYEAIRSSTMAYITLNDIPLEIQLPPYLDQLLHSQDDDMLDSPATLNEDELTNWGQEMACGWRLPSLTPWKSLLLLCGLEVLESYLQQGGILLLPQDRPVAENLVRFMKTVNITLSLTDIASLLDWDLEMQVYPVVRWFVRHRWAKIVDTVHPGLKTIFILPPKFHQPLPQLSKEFEHRFSHQSPPSLPHILATISKSDSHFFASVVKSRELIPIYYDIVHWMLEHDLLITLHLRIRLVATRELKIRVRQRRREALLKRAYQSKTGHKPDTQQLLEELDLDTTYLTTQSNSGFPWLFLSPQTAGRYTRRLSSVENRRDTTGTLWPSKVEQAVLDDEEEDGGSSLDADSGWESTEESLASTVIEDPGRATPLQRRWLSAMSEGKDPHIAKRFALVSQYFDGKRTDDEILHCAEISRKQLREVLHHYHEYVQTFLHPS